MLLATLHHIHAITLTNQCQCYVIFSHCRKPNVPTYSQNKRQRLRT